MNKKIREFLDKLRYPAPNSFIVETSSYCNLHCVGCDVPVMERKRRNLRIDEFKEILGQLKEIGVKHLDLDFGGEPLLNPDIVEIVRLTREAGMTSFFSTNGMLLDRYAEGLVRAGIDHILVDLDGASSESYLKFRVGGDFERVKENIGLLVEEKKKQGNRTPLVSISFIVTKYNENEIDDIKALARELDVDSLLVKTLITDWLLPDVSENSKKLLPENKAFHRSALLGGKNSVCDFLNRRAVIYSNGNVGLCCRDIRNDYSFGNVFEKPLKEILSGIEYLDRKERIKKRDFKICDCCLTGVNTGTVYKGGEF